MRDIMADRVDAGIGGGSIAGQWISIRGTGQNRIDVVVDNAFTSNQMWVHQNRFQLDPSMIKNLSVEKGAGAASAGIGASNGALRATTVDATDLLRDGKPAGARLGFNYRSNNGINGNAAVYGNHSGFDALLLGSWQKDKDYKDGRGNRVTNSALNQDNYLGKLSYQINDKNRISASYRQEHFDGNTSIRPEFRCFNDCLNGEQQPIDSTQKTLNFEYKGSDLGKLGNIDANIYRIRSEDRRKPFGTAGWTPAPDAAHETAEGKTLGANLGFTTPFGNGHNLKYGLNFREEKASSKNVNEGKKEYGIYAEGIWNLSPVTLTTGLRYDRFKLDLPLNGWQGLALTPALRAAAARYGYNTKESASSLSPSLGVIWEVSPALNINAKWAMVSRSPQLDYPIRDSIGANQTLYRRSIVAGLKPERTQTAEIGASWKHNGFNVSGSVFHQKINNYIDLMPGIANPDYPDQPVNAAHPWTNVGSVKSNGYELNVAYRHQGLTLRAGTMYNKVESEGFVLTADGRSLLPQGQQWLASAAYRFNRPSLEIGWRSRFAQSVTFKGIDSRSNPNTFRRAGYGVHDIFANWQPLGHDAMNVNFAVNNIGNKVYRSHSQAADAVTDARPRTFPEPGREYRLSVNYRF